MANNLKADFRILCSIYEAYEEPINALMGMPTARPVFPIREPAPVFGPDMPVHPLVDRAGQQDEEAAESDSSPEPDNSNQPVALAPRRLGSQRHVHDPDKTARPPPGIDLSIREICAFCPGWFNIPDVIARAYRNGWDRASLGKAIAFHMGQVGGQLAVDQDQLMQQNVSKGGKLYLRQTQQQRFDRNALLNLGRDNDMTATNWHYRDWYANQLGWNAYTQATHSKDVELSRFREGVVNWPTGQDRLLFTEILEYDRANPSTNLTTADYGRTLQQLQHIVVPPAPMLPENRDTRALDRFKQTQAYAAALR